MYSALGFNVDLCASRRIKRKLLLIDGAQVTGTHPVADLRQLERAIVVRDDAAEDRRALVERKAGRQRILDFAECTARNATVIGDRLRLFASANIHLRLKRASEENRRKQARAEAHDRIVAFLEHEQLA